MPPTPHLIANPRPFDGARGIARRPRRGGRGRRGPVRVAAAILAGVVACMLAGFVIPGSGGAAAAGPGAELLRVDPAGIAVTVVHPEGLSVPDGAVVFTIVLSDAGGAVLRTEEFALASAPSAGGGPATPTARAAGEVATMFGIAEADIARFADLQAAMRARSREAPGESRLDADIFARPCRSGPPRAGSLTFLVRLAADGPAVALGDPVPVPTRPEAIAPCGNGGAG